MRFGSVCSGIEAASVAWEPLGWKAAWLAEIEPFPSAVLAHHYPEVPNLGDMTTLPARIRLGEVEAPDVFCGGTPCQAFSVAGLRRSLDDARGNLSLTFCEIANAIDSVRRSAGMAASIVFWENVPGVLSTKDNAFGCFLAGLAGEDEALVAPGGRWTNAGFVDGPTRAVAWRVLDAQYFGLAQRRKRVFVVASAREDFDPAAVLLEFDGVRRDSAPSRETRQRVAPTIDASFGRLQGCSGQDANHEHGHLIPSTSMCLNAGGQRRLDAESETLIPTIGGGFDGPVAQAVSLRGRDGGGTAELGGDIQNALRASQGGGDKPHVLAVAFPIDTQNMTEGHASGGLGFGQATDPSFTLTKGHSHAVATAMQVRRLTPVECERLQGFPDGYTNIPWRKKPASECPDGPRYKALGNSWAVPVVRWIGRRIAAATSSHPSSSQTCAAPRSPAGPSPRPTADRG
jgi:DNA (cytosine-5)-methyltransferase 1